MYYGHASQKNTGNLLVPMQHVQDMHVSDLGLRTYIYNLACPCDFGFRCLPASANTKSTAQLCREHTPLHIDENRLTDRRCVEQTREYGQELNRQWLE
jgi:hypothetical protein